MSHAAARISLAAAALLASGCGPGPRGTRDPLDATAEAYVKLSLAIGRHDPLYVDAYYGPKAWKEEADRGAPVPLPELLARTRALRASLPSAAGPSDRRLYLEKQLAAAEACLRRMAGERSPLDDECRAVYDAGPARHRVEEFESAQRDLERLVPGSGPLEDRVESLRRAVRIPPGRLETTLAAALDAARRANAALVRLPAGEAFDAVLVSGKPWGAYNWYLGGYKSRIEVNVDLPTELGRLLSTVCHEGYPGHHVYNVLLEKTLVRGKGWVEFTVYPLYSPQSLLAEGTANAGEDILFSDAERRRLLTDVLAPLAGVPPDAVLRIDGLAQAMRPLRYVEQEAARMLLDEGRSEDEVVAFIRRWQLTDEKRARRAIEFFRTYRSYVFNYTLGEDLVRAHIGDGPDRRARFYALLDRPVVPSQLAAGH